MDVQSVVLGGVDMQRHEHERVKVKREHTADVRDVLFALRAEEHEKMERVWRIRLHARAVCGRAIDGRVERHAHPVVEHGPVRMYERRWRLRRRGHVPTLFRHTMHHSVGIIPKVGMYSFHQRSPDAMC